MHTPHRPNILVVVDKVPSPCCAAFPPQLHEVADVRVLPASHDFDADPSFPDPSVDALAVVGVTPALVDRVVATHAPKITWVHCFFAGKEQGR